ncbi:MAG: nucleotidyltransferase family protein [Acidobacteriota bacterium]|nr:MAG: nucleotidyltransferase family protein [Acidobacteriota bacterium]
MMRDLRLGIVLLAAGGSQRLGKPKQLLPYKGTSLIRHAAVTAMISDHPAVAVLGAHADEVRRELCDLSIDSVVNTEWEDGIGKSISKGVAAIRKNYPDLEAVIIMLCDQPGVSPETIARLAEKHRQTGLPIVASSYGGTKGVPALFGYEMFGELLALEGDNGAKCLIEKYDESLVTLVHAPEAAFDVDTEKDVKQLSEMKAFA